MMNVALKTLLLTTALTVASSSFVFAEGWTGFRIGAGGGGNFATTSVDSYGEGWSDNQNEDLGYADVYVDTLSVYHPDSETRINEDGGDYEPLVDMGKAGAFGTVELGADLQTSSLVMGLTANYDFGKTRMGQYSFSDSDVDNDDNEEDENGDSDAELTTDLDLGNSWAVGSRIGFLPTDSSLVFVSGGFQRTKADLSNSFEGSATVGEEGRPPYSDEWTVNGGTSEWLNGYYVGGGIETMMAESLSLKLEYRFTNLESATSTSTEGDAENNNDTYGSVVSSTVDPILHSVRATIGIRF